MRKKILLLSDTHGTFDDFIAKYAARADEIWHAGDVGTMEVLEKLEQYAPVRGVYGNIDGGKLRIILPEYNFFETAGIKILMLHIGGYPGKYSPRAKELIRKFKPDVFISGHSHILKIMPDRKYGLLHMNPGAAGKSGFHKVRSMIRFEINEGKIENPEVIERPR
jgi:putative phosphoesterase